MISELISESLLLQVENRDAGMEVSLRRCEVITPVVEDNSCARVNNYVNSAQVRVRCPQATAIYVKKIALAINLQPNLNMQIRKCTNGCVNCYDCDLIANCKAPRFNGVPASLHQVVSWRLGHRIR